MFFLMTRRPPRSTLFPNTTLCRSRRAVEAVAPHLAAAAHLVAHGPRPLEVVGQRGLPLRARDAEGHSASIAGNVPGMRSEEHTSELQSRQYLVCRLLLEKKKKQTV